MADQAEITVKNVSTEGEVIVIRNGSKRSEVLRDGGEIEESVFMTGETLIIWPPKGVDGNSVMFYSEIDLDIICSKTGSYWEIKIRPNALPKEIPTTVNVTVGDDR